MEGSKKLSSPASASSTLGYCTRLALGLTAVVGLDTLIVLPFQRGPGILTIAAAIFAGFALVIWCASLSIGLTVVIGGKACGLLRQFAYGRPKDGLRDDWLDEPLLY